MTLVIKNKRKDGKFMVTLGFDNGVKMNKIVTNEQLEKLKIQSDN